MISHSVTKDRYLPSVLFNILRPGSAFSSWNNSSVLTEGAEGSDLQLKLVSSDIQDEGGKMERGRIEGQQETNQRFQFLLCEMSNWREDTKKKKRYRRKIKKRHVMDLEETTKDRGMRQILTVTMQKPVLISINFNQHSTKTLVSVFAALLNV